MQAPMPIERDRTAELNNIFSQRRAHSPLQRFNKPLHSSTEVQTFSRCAQAFSQNIVEISSIILRLTELSSRQTVFEDQSSEITGLTQIVKVTLQKLHKDLDVLEQLKNNAINAHRNCKTSSSISSSYRKTGQSAENHSNTVVESLKSKLARTGQDFRFALQQQTKNMKSNSMRRNLFSSSDQPQSLQHALNNDLQQYQQQVLALDDRNLQYSRKRLEDVLQVEAAVTEVSELFSNFSRVVSEQAEHVVRIDANVSEALLNINAGSNELLRYLSHLTSNRGLIIKLLGILFVFLLFFGFFVAR